MTSPTAAAAGVREEIDRIVSVLSGRHGELAEAMVENIKAEIPPYLRTADAAVLEDVLAHCERHAELILAVARQAREPLRAELAFAREAGVRRVRQGIPIDGLLAAFRVGHRTVWDAILEEADDGTVGREAAIALARPAMEYIDIASTQVAEAYTREGGQAQRRGGSRAARPDREPARRPRSAERPASRGAGTRPRVEVHCCGGFAGRGRRSPGRTAPSR